MGAALGEWESQVSETDVRNQVAPVTELEATADTPPAEYRRLIIEVLAAAQDEGLTLAEIERRVSEQLKDLARDSIEDQVQSLLQWDLVARMPRKKRFLLTPRGSRFLSGLQAIRGA